ncbi:transmembrane protein 128 [Hydra vulgaris]|uniref:Transmembrane protein 128 n=1 Tax=Hydra vulgaris TaxID=6087 RepID=A0ABM4BLK6_HYDVU
MSESASLLGVPRYRSRKFDEITEDNFNYKNKQILEKHKQKTSISHYLHIIFWMLAGIATFHYTDFYIALRVDTRIERLYLYPGLAMIFVSVLIAVFMIGYYHYYKGISDYEVHCPFAVPVATVLFITGMVIMCIALWPVWNVFTPFILITMFMGTIFSLSLLPI